jgi:hypothetical protein
VLQKVLQSTKSSGSLRIRPKILLKIAGTASYFFFFLLFFTQEWTPHFLRFYLFFTVMIPAAPQETVGEAGIEPGTAA